MKKDDYSYVDEGIRPAVMILNKHGFKTFESCQGGEGHFVQDPFVSFEGTEFDLIRAYEVCKAYDLCVHECQRVYRKIDIYKNNKDVKAKIIGQTWDTPYNRIAFLNHSKTGTIFCH